MLPTHSLDDIDRALLRLLQDEGRISNAKLAERLALSQSPCWRRLKRLESEGYIERYQAILNPTKLGLGVTAFVRVRFASHDVELTAQFEQSVQTLPQVLACYNVTGEADYLLHVVIESLEAYGDFTLNTLRRLPGVSAIYSSLSLRQVKASTKLPL